MTMNMNTDALPMSARYRLARTAAGLKQDELARACGVSRQAVARCQVSPDTRRDDFKAVA